MPKDHARKKALATIKGLYGLKHTDAIAFLESEDREALCYLLDFHPQATRYRKAVDFLTNIRSSYEYVDPTPCPECGWEDGGPYGTCVCYNGEEA
ncbi:hypothetical protein [Streptomyces erythrochromogenes]|uniref:hypothetical protein n=1 Tax=Streptomyces erythrochromogenes TaxID=285574 RepID=UPI0037CD12C0